MAEVPAIVDCTLVVVIGPVSSGKSWLVQQWLRGMERSVTVDTTAECVSSGDFYHVWYDPGELGKRLLENPFYYRIAYHPSDDIIHDFNWCVALMWLAEKPRWIIVDEVHEVATAFSLPRRAEMLFRYARHVELGVICSSQKFADVSKLMTDSARMVVLFYTNEPAELDSIRRRFGDEVLAQVKALRPCIYDDGSKIVHQEPQCLVWIRGRGTRVFSLGDKVMTGDLTPQSVAEVPAVPAVKDTPPTGTGDESEWQNSGREEQRPPEAPSLAHPSGRKRVKAPPEPKGTNPEQL